MNIMDAAKAAAARPTYKELKAEVERLRTLLRESLWVDGESSAIDYRSKVRAALGEDRS